MAGGRISALERAWAEAEEVVKCRLDNAAMYDQDNALVLVVATQLIQLALDASREFRDRLEARTEAMVAPLSRAELMELRHECFNAQHLIATFPFSKLSQRVRRHAECWRDDFRSLHCARQGAAEQCIGLKLARTNQAIPQCLNLLAPEL